MGTTKSVIEKERELLSIALQELRPQLDPNAKKQVARRVKKTSRLIDLYLNGYVGDCATAKKIIVACRNNIIKREQRLMQQNAA